MVPEATGRRSLQGYEKDAKTTGCCSARRSPRARKSIWRSRKEQGRSLRQNPPQRVLNGR
jgi:hypothetical protein